MMGGVPQMRWAGFGAEIPPAFRRVAVRGTINLLFSIGYLKDGEPLPGMGCSPEAESAPDHEKSPPECRAVSGIVMGSPAHGDRKSPIPVPTRRNFWIGGKEFLGFARARPLYVV